MNNFKYYECGICDHIHPWTFNGDCRDDANRFTTDIFDQLNDGSVVATWSERCAADSDL